MHDHIILGGGCAGFQLAEALVSAPERAGEQIAIMDTSFKTPHKTWCIWAKKPHAYSHLVMREWKKLRFAGPNGEKTHDLGAWSYQYIPGEAFFDWHLERFRSHDRVDLVKGEVQDMGKTEESFWAQSTGGTLQGRQMYSSFPPKLSPATGHRLVWQHFKGWFIRTDQPTFDPEVVTLMDFNVSQDRGAAFVYILPLTASYALVEYTVLSAETWSEEAYEQGIIDYLDRQYPGIQYSVEKKEGGKIPMTTHPFPRVRPDGIMNIGSAAGRVKPTTGYAFRRIMEDTQRIMMGRPKAGFQASARFNFYDRLLLRIIDESPQAVAGIMSRLFTTQPISRILRFLDERTSPLEEVLIFSRLPKMRFLRSLTAEIFTTNSHEKAPEILHPAT